MYWVTLFFMLITAYVVYVIPWPILAALTGKWAMAGFIIAGVGTLYVIVGKYAFGKDTENAS